MRVNRSLHIDKGEQDGDGLYDHYYEFELFEFEDGAEKLVARSYTDTPSEVHFLRKEVGSARQSFTPDDLSKKLTRDAVSYLIEQGKSDIRWLSGRGVNGYEAITPYVSQSGTS